MDYTELLEIIASQLKPPDNYKKTNSVCYDYIGSRLPTVAFTKSFFEEYSIVITHKLQIALRISSKNTHKRTHHHEYYDIADPNLIQKLQQTINNIEQ